MFLKFVSTLRLTRYRPVKKYVTRMFSVFVRGSVAGLPACAVYAPACAESTAATLDSYAGLDAVFTVTCTPLNFGVLLRPARSSSSEAVLQPHGAFDILEIYGVSAGVAASNNTGRKAQLDKSTVTGAEIADGANLVLSASGDRQRLIPDSLLFIPNVPAPATAPTGMYIKTKPRSPCPVTNRAATCYVGA